MERAGRTRELVFVACARMSDREFEGSCVHGCLPDGDTGASNVRTMNEIWRRASVSPQARIHRGNGVSEPSREGRPRTRERAVERRMKTDVWEQCGRATLLPSLGRQRDGSRRRLPSASRRGLGRTQRFMKRRDGREQQSMGRIKDGRRVQTPSAGARDIIK